MAKYRPHLQHINLDYSPASDDDLIELLKSCRELRPENIHGGSRGDLYCQSVAAQYPDLKKINVNNATELGLIELLKGCPTLHPDNITGCNQKGDGFLQAVVRFRPKITEISLNACDLLSDRGLATLVSKKYPDHKYISCCSKVAMLFTFVIYMHLVLRRMIVACTQL